MMSATWIVVIILIIKSHLGISINQPKFSSCASWNTNATTFADISLIGQQPISIFIHNQSTIYAVNRENSHILIWFNELLATDRTIYGNFNNLWSIFVTTNGDIYIDNGYLNTTNHEIVMNVNSSCTGLFVDIKNNLYCSSADKHRVFKKELNVDTILPIAIAGTGCPGPLSNMLDHPHGIFIDVNFNMYVADTFNNRIQHFIVDQLNAITVAGFGAKIFFIFNRPTSIVLDADNNLFIVDSYNHRIVRSISNGFECLVGCSGNNGALANQLYNPQTMAFDSNGNIFVTDMNNHRIQKFSLIQNSCVTTSTTACPTPTTATVEISISLPSQCSSYTLITDATRNVAYYDGTIRCDTSGPIASLGWFRFSESAGTIIPNCTVSTHKCGTQGTGWYNGSYPSTGGNTTSGTVCYNWDGNSCWRSNSISIINCNGYYVFYLIPPPKCDVRYCTM